MFKKRTNFTALIAILALETTLATPADDFVSSWKTDNPGTSNSTSITIPTYGIGYDYDVDWDNDGAFDELGLTGNVTHDFGVAGTYTIRIQGTFPRIYLNDTGDRGKLLSVDQWGTGRWASMAGAFSGAWTLEVTASDIPDFSAVIDMSYMFHSAQSANPDTSSWDVSSVTEMGGMFSNATLANPNTSARDVSRVHDMTNLRAESPPTHHLSKS